MGERISNSGDNNWVTIRQIAYQPKNILGRGSDGSTVYRGKFGHRQAAIKEVDTTSFKWVKAEIEILIRCHGHPNVTRHYAKEEKGRFCYLALELCQGNLEQYISSPAKFSGEKLVAMDLLKQITKGLQYLHENKLVHCVLQPDNILISQPDAFDKVRAVISDLVTGSRDHTGRRLISQDISGFASHEVLESTVYTEATDVFSLGCIYYYVITMGKQIFENRQNSVDRESHFKFPNGHENPLIQDCIEQMIKRNPTERPTCMEILQGPLYWNPAQTLQYLESVTDWLVSGILHPDLSKQLEGNKDAIIQGNWRNALSHELRDLLDEDYQFGQKYDYKSVVGLLRMIRNKSRHYNDLPYNVRKVFQSFPDGYVKYFTSSFLRLIFHVFLPFRSFTVNADLNIRNHRSCDCQGMVSANGNATIKSTVLHTQLHTYPSSIYNDDNTEVRANVKVATITNVIGEELATGVHARGTSKQWEERYGTSKPPGHLFVERHVKHDQDQISTTGSKSSHTNSTNPIPRLKYKRVEDGVSTTESDVDDFDQEVNGVDVTALLIPKQTHPVKEDWNGSDLSIPEVYESRNANVSWQYVEAISTEKQNNSITDNRKQDDGIIDSQLYKALYRTQVSEEERKQKLKERRSRSVLKQDIHEETIKGFRYSQNYINQPDQHGQQAFNENSRANKSLVTVYLKPVDNNVDNLLTRPFERTQSYHDLRPNSDNEDKDFPPLDIELNVSGKMEDDITAGHFLVPFDSVAAPDENVQLVPWKALIPVASHDEHVHLILWEAPMPGVSQKEHVPGVPKRDTDVPEFNENPFRKNDADLRKQNKDDKGPRPLSSGSFRSPHMGSR